MEVCSTWKRSQKLLLSEPESVWEVSTVDVSKTTGSWRAHCAWVGAGRLRELCFLGKFAVSLKLL